MATSNEWLGAVITSEKMLAVTTDDVNYHLRKYKPTYSATNRRPDVRVAEETANVAANANEHTAGGKAAPGLPMTKCVSVDAAPDQAAFRTRQGCQFWNLAKPPVDTHVPS
jgi:hypothetical protein